MNSNKISMIDQAIASLETTLLSEERKLLYGEGIEIVACSLQEYIKFGHKLQVRSTKAKNVVVEGLNASWDPVPGAIGYSIFVGNELVAKSTTTSFDFSTAGFAIPSHVTKTAKEIADEVRMNE